MNTLKYTTILLETSLESFFIMLLKKYFLGTFVNPISCLLHSWEAGCIALFGVD